MSHPALVREPMVDSIRSGLIARADATATYRLLSAYPGRLPFIGVTVPEVWRIVHAAATSHRIPTREHWSATIRHLFENAWMREEQYAAIALIWHPRYREWATSPWAAGLYRRLITEGASADLVDYIATAAGAVLLTSPESERALLRTWALAEEMWLRRAAIVAQHRLGARTDRDLLLRCIVFNLEDRSPIIRTGIGLALRRYGESGPDAHVWVDTTIEQLGPRLAPTARREATRAQTRAAARGRHSQVTGARA